MKFVIRLLGTMLGIWLSTLIVPAIYVATGTTVLETVLILAGIALVLTLVNGLVRPIIKFFAFPLYLLTFGLFALVTNALVFMLAGWAATSLGLPFIAGDFWSALAGGTITAIVSSIAVAVLDTDRDE